MFHLEQEIISINRLKLKCFAEGKKNPPPTSRQVNIHATERQCIDSLQVCGALPPEGAEHREQRRSFFFQLVLSKCLKSETKRSSLASRG